MKKFAKTKSLYLFINQFEWVNHLCFDIFACVHTHIYSNDIYIYLNCEKNYCPPFRKEELAFKQLEFKRSHKPK